MNKKLLNSKNFAEISALAKGADPKKLASALSNLDTQSISLLGTLASDLEESQELYNEVNYLRHNLTHSHYFILVNSIIGLLIGCSYSKTILEYGTHYFGETLFMGLGASFLFGYLTNIYSCASFFYSPNKENLEHFKKYTQRQNEVKYATLNTQAVSLFDVKKPKTNKNDTSNKKPS